MWFSDLFGFNEESPDQVRSQLFLEGGRIHSRVNGRSFQCGVLEVITLDKLRSSAHPVEDAGASIHVGEVVGDVRDLHEFVGERALFQVASQFNLLEMVHPGVTPEMGVGRYEYDLTQGPACAIACGAGTVYRNYFVPVDGHVGQTEDHQIDCLDLLGKELNNKDLMLWRMRNGYALANEAGLNHIAKELGVISEAGRERLKGMLKIGLQWDTEVTLGASPGPIVSQAFCSALPVAYSDVDQAHWEAWARLILEAAYEATLYAGWMNYFRRGHDRVYLTMLGGGAFGNHSDWILDALEKALNKFSCVPLDVRVVSYGASDMKVMGRLRSFTGE